MTSSVNFHRVRGFSASNGPRYVSGNRGSTTSAPAARISASTSSLRLSTVRTKRCRRDRAASRIATATARPEASAGSCRQSPPSASVSSKAARVAMPWPASGARQQQQGQSHLRQPQQHRPAQVHGDRAQQRGQRETAYARGRARPSCPLAPLALHADQQADAQCDGEWKWTLHVHVPALTRCRRRRRNCHCHPEAAAAAIGYAGDFDGGVRTAFC